MIWITACTQINPCHFATKFEKIDFLDSAVKFLFWKDRFNYELVEIEFHFDRSTEFFNVSLERDDIKCFINLLENAIKNI